MDNASVDQYEDYIFSTPTTMPMAIGRNEDQREYFSCPLPSSYGALKCVEDVLKECDREAYEHLMSQDPFMYVKIGNPTREVYGEEAYNIYTSTAARDNLRWNTQCRLKASLRSRIAAAMQALRRARNNPELKKAGSAVKDLGCTLEFLEKHSRATRQRTPGLPLVFSFEGSEAQAKSL